MPLNSPIDARHGAGILPVMKHLLMILVAFSLCLPVAAQDKGKRLPTDFKSLKALAEKGDARAQNQLGYMYDNGRGVQKDDREAVAWFRKAALQGHASAQINLGLMYAEGEGVPQDDKEAVAWYRKAALQGEAMAQYNLGVMYYKGQGVLEDYVAAYAWLNLAAANGDALAMKNKPLIAKLMTAEQIAKAQELSREMLKKNPKLLK